MKQAIWVLFALLCLITAPINVVTHGNESTIIALTNGSLIDGTGAPVIHDAVVIIKGERLLAVGNPSEISIPAEAQIVDLQGGTILPGFINAHVHQGFIENNLRAWAFDGVTTVRDLGGPRAFGLRDSLSADPRNARLIAAGPMVTVLDGYPDIFWGGGGLIVDSPEDARNKVGQLLDDGADIIKVSLETGGIFGMVGLNSWPILSPAQLNAVVETAHRRGTRVSAHVTNWPQLKLALDAGVNDIAHIVTTEVSDALIRRMVDNRVYWVPTFELMAGMRPPNAQRVLFDNLRRFVAAGGNVALGTDFAGANMTFQLGMPTREMEYMQAAGMTPMQIIVAATKNAAYVCNREKDLGTLEKGKIADIIVVKGDPLQDIHSLTHIQYVFHSGVQIRAPE